MERNCLVLRFPKSRTKQLYPIKLEYLVLLVLFFANFLTVIPGLISVVFKPKRYTTRSDFSVSKSYTVKRIKEITPTLQSMSPSAIFLFFKTSHNSSNEY